MFHREQRFQLVRNLEEYIFIHECILDHLTFKHRVDINVRNILEYIARNKELDSKSKFRIFKDLEFVGP